MPRKYARVSRLEAKVGEDSKEVDAASTNSQVGELGQLALLLF